jgi:hypothetical protein
MSSLVMGVHWGRPVGQVERFARSLRATGFDGTFVVFAGRCGSDEKARLNRAADVVVDLDAEYPAPARGLLAALEWARSRRGVRKAYPFFFEGAARTRRGCRRWSGLEYHIEGLQSLRYLHYQRYLAGLDPLPDAVLLTDLRDVVFQRDPFAEPVAELELFLEDPTARIGEQPYYVRWSRRLYGRSAVARFRDRPVSCSGTVAGTGAGVLSYLAEMAAVIESAARPMGYDDQSVHNALLHGGRLSSATVVANEHGRVLTMGMMATHTTVEGCVLNADGSVPAVLHQWDRHPELAARLEQKAEHR